MPPKRKREAIKMVLGDAGESNAESVAPVVRIEGGKKVVKDRTVKIRATPLEIQEWDRLTNLAGYKERATFFRELAKMYPELTHARKVEAARVKLVEAQAVYDAALKEH